MPKETPVESPVASNSAHQGVPEVKLDVLPHQTIWEALKAVSTEMPVIGKNKTAAAGKFSYSYANLEKIWEIAKPIIEKHGFLIIHYSRVDEIVTVARHESGQEIESVIKLS